jgi:hypothetical protein
MAEHYEPEQAAEALATLDAHQARVRRAALFTGAFALLQRIVEVPPATSR